MLRELRSLGTAAEKGYFVGSDVLRALAMKNTAL
jgi:prophage antirepressor-like protein